MDAVVIDLTLQFVGKFDYLHLTTAVARLVCSTIQAPVTDPDLADDVELAVSEACTNAIRHAPKSEGEDKVIVRLRAYSDRLVVEVMDHGEGFDLESVPEPRFDEHPENGYGTYVIRTIMDEVRYEQGSAGNTLTMIRYFRNGKRC